MAVDWFPIGRGARMPAVRNPRSEMERRCNRRVEITVKQSNQLPKLDRTQAIAYDVELGGVLEYYKIALQGTAGKYSAPHIAAWKANDIAKKVPGFLDAKKQEAIKKGLYCPTYGNLDNIRDMRITICGDLHGDAIIHFKNALQGTASKFDLAEVVIQKAWEIAEASLLFNRRYLPWKYASLPQPMDDDCEAASRVPNAPPNIAVCFRHGHILDLKSRRVIAKDIEDFRKSSATTRSARTR